MKKMKKLASLLLASVMALSMTATAFAVEEGDPGNPPAAPTNYSITVQKPADSSISIKDNTYNAYKLFDVVYYGTGDNTTYAYTLAESFKDFTYTVGGQTYSGDSADSTTSLVSYLRGIGDKSEEADAFAAAAFEYITTKGITPSGSATAADENGVTINLDSAGYYLISGTAKSATGETITAACALDTTHPTETVTVKADAPSIDKFIQEADSANGQDGNGTAQDVGSVVKFKLTSTVPNMTGYTKYTYTIHDTLSAGLTFDGASSVTVKVGDQTITQINDNYNVQSSTQDGEPTNVTIEFNPEAFIEFNAGASIEITYSATINEHALTTNVETNTVNLEYSNNPYDEKSHETTPDKKVYVYDFDIVIDKVVKDNNGTKLSGAKFVLYRGTDEAREYYFYNETTKKVEWKTVTPAEGQTVEDAIAAAVTAKTITEVETDTNGKASFKGLDSGSYKLLETVAPSGYNKLQGATDVTITAAYNEDGTLKTEGTSVTIDQDGRYSQTATVENSAGALLPSTGGIGTTIFYTAGIILMAGAVFFVIRRRRA